jgi:3-oxoacyl-[acyl-carrier protein] reductase
VLSEGLAVLCITADAAAPGPVASPVTTSFPSALVIQIPTRRLGQPHEVGVMVAWLSARKNVFATGEFIGVDGGFCLD